MFKIGHIADIHFGLKTHAKGWHENAYTNDLLTDRDIELLDCLYKAIEVFNKANINCLLIEGDIFETNHPSQLYQDLFQQWLKKIINTIPGIYVFIIPGNHDALNASEKVTTLSAFTYFLNDLPNVKIIENITCIPFNAEASFLFVPNLNKSYFKYDSKKPTIEDIEKEYNKKLNEAIKKAVAEAIDQNLPKPLMLVGHGFTPGMTHGFELNLSSFYGIIKPLPEIDYYFLGHVHKPQQKKNILIPGSLIYNSFIEEGEEKHIVVSTVQQQKITHEYFPVPARNLKTVYLDYKKGKFNYPDEEGYKDKIVRVIIRVKNRSEKSVVRQLFPDIDMALSKAYNIVGKEIDVIDNSAQKKNQIDSKSKYTDDVLLALWLEEKYSDNKKLKDDCLSTFVGVIVPECEKRGININE